MAQYLLAWQTDILKAKLEVEMVFMEALNIN